VTNHYLRSGIGRTITSRARVIDEAQQPHSLFHQ
jgi:hypothetical protein